MNRIENPAKPVKAKVTSFQPTFTLQSALFSPPRPDTSRVMFTPMHYEPNYAYPLIVWLHGHGGNERQLPRVMPLISMRNYVAAAPRGGVTVARPLRFTWDGRSAGMAAAAQRVFACVDAASDRFHVAAHRVFLAGLGCGGTAALRVALQYPSQFAGALSIGGPFPADGQPLASLRQARRLPLFIAQGRDSRAYPLERTCAELHLFHAAGLSVMLRQYPCGDELYTDMLHDMNAWIMEQVTGVPAETGQEDAGSFDLN